MKVSKQNIKNLLSSVSSDGRGHLSAFIICITIRYSVLRIIALRERGLQGGRADVFFPIWKSKARLKEIDNIDTYLYITVRNEALRHISRSNSVNKNPDGSVIFI